jgi:hypothetical protein
MEQRFAKVEGNLKRLIWMVAINLTATAGVIVILLSAISSVVIAAQAGIHVPTA